MKKIASLLTAAGFGVSLASCSTSGANPPSVPNVASLTSNVLQLNVGTANLFADTPAANIVGLNVVVTYRQPGGAKDPGGSAVLVSTPTFTVPAALPAGVPNASADGWGSTILLGPSSTEGGTTSMTATSQTPNASAITTFGDDGGAFGLGLEPFNYAGKLGTAGVAGVPANIVPYPVPLYDAIAAGGGTDTNSFLPGGGLPAFNPAGNAAGVDGGFPAVSEGLDVFELTPTLGTYTLSVLIPGNTGTVTQSATATITNNATAPGLLPPFISPVPVVSASGGVSFPATALTGAETEAYIQVVDYGPTTAGATSCVGAKATTPIYYTVELPKYPTIASGSICSAAQNTTASGAASDGDSFTVQGIAFDYPAFEASYPSSLGVTAPSLAGDGAVNAMDSSATHQADITVSSQGIWNQPVGGLPIVNAAGGAALPTGVVYPNSVRRAGR